MSESKGVVVRWKWAERWDLNEPWSDLPFYHTDAEFEEYKKSMDRFPEITYHKLEYTRTVFPS